MAIYKWVYIQCIYIRHWELRNYFYDLAVCVLPLHNTLHVLIHSHVIFLYTIIIVMCVFI